MIHAGQLLVAFVFVFAALDWLGWATGVQGLTRLVPAWPQMTPWTALWLAALGAAILLQSGSPSASRVWVGRGVAAVVGFFALAVLAEYATARSLGVDQVWFGEAVRTLQSTWPGRPSPQTAVTTLFLAVAVGFIRVSRSGTRILWAVSVAVALAVPGITLLAYLFDAVALVRVAQSTGMAIPTALGLLLLGVATVLVRPGANLVAWWLSRTNRWSILRMGLVVAGFPLLLATAWRFFSAIDLGVGARLALSAALGSTVTGASIFYLSYREQQLRDAQDADRVLLQASSDAMLDPQVLLEVVTDSSGQIVDFLHTGVNQATCDYLGLSRQDLLGRGVVETMPGIKGTLIPRFVRCLESGEPLILDEFSYDNEILGDSRLYDMRVTRATPTSLVLTWRDVTERFHSAERIANSEAMLRANVESMLNPHVLIKAVRDPDGTVVDFRYLSVNRAACAYLGMEKSELVGHTQLESLPNLKGSELHQRYARCLEDGQPVVFDNYSFFNEILDDARRYDIRATRSGPDLLSLTWSDVTDRFDAAQRLAASEQNYRLLAENSGDVIVHIRGSRVAWISPSVDGVLGAPPEYWVGRQLKELVPVQDVAALRARISTVVAGESVRERIQVLSAGGVKHWFDLYAKPFYDADGNPDGGLVTLRLVDDEVAAQKEAERAREQQAESDARYRRSMDTAAIGMCLTTPDGAFLEVNPAMCELFGYDAESLMTMNWQELTAPDSLGLADEELRGIFAGLRDSYRVIGQLVHADGHRIWADVAVSCIRDPNGRVENLSGQITDITAEVQAREQLALSDEQNRLLAQRLGRQSRRMADELDSAAKYLASIMPKGLTGAVNVVSRYIPSRELGGDCFDYAWVDDDHLRVYLIDVSGHGLAPALLSASVHNMIRSGSPGAKTLLAPEVLLTELNSLFQMEQQDDHYFTMWCGVYQASTRTLTYSNAGSPPPFAFIAADGDTCSIEELSLASTPIGMFEDTTFTAHNYPVPAGSQILIYSDGASEITLAGDHQLKPTAFKELVARVARSPGWSLDGLIDELHALSPAGAFEDDFSLIRLGFD
jgi:PAS domain S-box-containing protein